jgi:ABC-type sugar transport system substrate-binding protein
VKRLAVALPVALTLAVLAAPLAAEAQQAAKMARIGYLATDLGRVSGPTLREAFREGLRHLGYVEGRNVVIENRDAEGKLERLPALAAELAALKVDAIVAAVEHCPPWPPSKRPGPCPLFSLVSEIR